MRYRGLLTYMACGALVSYHATVFNIAGAFVLGWIVQHLEPG